MTTQSTADTGWEVSGEREADSTLFHHEHHQLSSEASREECKVPPGSPWSRGAVAGQGTDTWVPMPLGTARSPGGAGADSSSAIPAQPACAHRNRQLESKQCLKPILIRLIYE